MSLRHWRVATGSVKLNKLTSGILYCYEQVHINERGAYCLPTCDTFRIFTHSLFKKTLIIFSKDINLGWHTVYIRTTINKEGIDIVLLNTTLNMKSYSNKLFNIKLEELI